MLKLHRKLGSDRFPLIAMNYYPNLRARYHPQPHPHHYPLMQHSFYTTFRSTQRLIEPSSYPAVVKVSSTHAGAFREMRERERELKKRGNLLKSPPPSLGTI
jgi:hypothetical protein